MHAPTKRRGLAPLELVIWLPILLFTAALFVNLGTMAAWRVRGEVVARDAVWRVRYPRTGQNEPRPVAHVWPDPARFEVRGSAPLDALDHPVMQAPVVHGPLPNGFGVNPTLQPLQGNLVGVSEIERRFPLLRKLGRYRSGEIRHDMLNGKFQTAHVGTPNVYRRIKVLYALPTTRQSLPQAFVDAVSNLLSIPHLSGLDVLDHDEDVRRYYGYYADLHPTVRTNMCELDPQTVYDARVVPLVDVFDDRGEVRLGRISLLPRSLTSFYLRMYRSAIAQLEQQIQSLQQEQTSIQQQIQQIPQQRRQYENQISQLQSQLSGNPPPTADEAATINSQIAGLQSSINLLPAQQQQLQARLGEIPGEIASAQAEIATIEPKIEQLEQFQTRLDAIERRLKIKAREYLLAKQAAEAGN